ncbi:formate dehydrogenase accessory sulfurtransferase FdhD [Paenibacillus rigui]|uniref:Sulfur carrier protein FdhD n=1 Tax=Paenibacillus rigui TaxID=554312 RepID=A0A229UX76_9BACL|nr:formate dehydrogenase accessory sulfurtransferase FdhD [Paenibacillus rigui]OXM88000.1 formate dehydrogenase family accessory protein FdhD [Paenibacillus rigui]
MDQEATVKRGVWKYKHGQFIRLEDDIVTEVPLTLKVDREEFATMVCTPTYMEELVIGFLASEGLIRSMEDIRSLSLNTSRGFADVELTAPQNTGKDWHQKRFIASCCGKSRQFYLHNDARTAKTIVSRDSLSAERCISLMQELQQGSADFHKTGGLHNAALGGADGLLLTRSDIGRHNAIDKIYGHCIRHRISMKGKVLAISGRVSSEILLKAAKIGVGLLLSKSAPTELALKLAEDLGITVVGFIRGHSFNVYTHPERIVHDGSPS